MINVCLRTYINRSYFGFLEIKEEKFDVFLASKLGLVDVLSTVKTNSTNSTTSPPLGMATISALI